MKQSQIELNQEVSDLLNGLNHPLREEIDYLRYLILSGNAHLKENIKWNGPNYSIGDKDRVTIRVYPPKQVQVILHCGAKKLAIPENRQIDDNSGLLAWKENDRAVITFKNMDEIQERERDFQRIVQEWVNKANDLSEQ